MARKKLKICQICAVDFTLKHFLLPLISKLEEKYKVTTLCSKGEYIEEFLKNGHDFQEIKINRNFNLLLHFKSILNLRKIIISNKFDIIHCHSPIASLILRISCLFLKKKPIIIYSAHGFYFHDEMNKFYKLLHISLEKILSFNTDFIFSQSYEDYKSAIKYKFIKENKIFHISNGINISKFINSKETYKIDIINFKNKHKIIDDTIIGFIGRLSKEKGFEEFLDASEYLINKYNNIAFVVIGDFKHGKDSFNINKKLNKLKKSNKFIFLGYQECIPMYLGLMDIFCLPSYREGMPRSIIEAMVSQKAIIASNIRGCREEIKNQETGLLIPTKDSEALINSIEKLILDKNLINYLGTNAKNFAINHFDEVNVIKKQINIIDKISQNLL